VSLPNIKIALVISPGQLVQSGGWSNFSRSSGETSNRSRPHPHLASISFAAWSASSM
jgi:hypothetical protein